MKSKRFFWVLLALLIVSSLVLGACGGKTTEEPVVVETEEPDDMVEETFVACQVTDVGGIDDKSFNATAWKGVNDAIAALGIEGKYLESQQQTDYEANINAFIEEGCDIIIPVGFLLADATAAAAAANPDVPFAIVDVNYVPADNIYGSGFAIDQATFLAGYLAAGMTETGIVGTYGGINIPPVTQFMDGFVLGVEKYNEVHGTDVQVLGWDIETQDGLFAGNFESTDDGRTLGESLLDEGADIIMPVAGPVGSGTLAVLEERDSGYLIGVDNDWSADYAYPNQADYILASALKNMDLFVSSQIEAVYNGTFVGGNLAGTLENGYVGLAYGSVVGDMVPDDLKAEIEDLTAGIIAGDVATLPPAPPDLSGITLGTEDEPIQVLFVPSVDVDFMISSGDLIEQALNDATGLFFEVSVPTSYAATIEEMCASPTDTIGFIPAMGYALANQLCGVEPALASVRYGWNVYWTEFLVARDSDFQTFEDLEGATWAYPDATSTSGYLYPVALFDDMGITVGDTLEAGGHPQSVKAVYNGEADVATAYFSAPLLPEGTWSTDMAPDIPDEFVPDCGLNEDGKLYCGEYRVLDARAAIAEEAPDVVQKVRILGLSKEIPNDTMSFSPDFPDVLKQIIIDAITAYVGSEPCNDTLCNENFYDWTGVAPIFDENFDGIRILMEAQGITLENIGE
jgi:phosphate/phosphite/phosphonate ABC transporter binding protein